MRSKVVEIKCSRCDRVEHGHMESASNSFNGTLTGADPVDVHLEDLCGPCVKTVKKHLDAISKKIEGLSPDRKEKVVAKKTAPVKAPSPVEGKPAAH